MINYEYGVYLGPISKINSVTMYDWRNEPSIYKWCRQYEPLEKWNHEGWLNSLASRKDVKMYGIFDPKTHQPKGVCGLTDLDLINRRAEFSLYVGPDHQSNGYGKAALKTLLCHAFMTLNLETVWGETYEGNKAFEMFTSLGFQLEGTRRNFYYREGKYIGAHLVSITKGEFSAYSGINIQSGNECLDDLLNNPTVRLTLRTTEDLNQGKTTRHPIGSGEDKTKISWGPRSGFTGREGPEWTHELGGPSD